ncbi:MAG: endonuclease/exonuclease/phosphatase family protein [Planctomycetota bacterium]
MCTSQRLVVLSVLGLSTFGATASANFLVDGGPRDPGSLRIANWNVWQSSILPDENEERAEAFGRVVQAVDADIWFLQELHVSSSVLDFHFSTRFAPDSGPWYVHSHGGEAIVSRYPLSFLQDNPEPDAGRSLPMALVDLPDDHFGFDLYAGSAHFRCCGGTGNDPDRQREADALVGWLRDVNLPGEYATLIAGDLNLVGGQGPLETLLTGDIVNEDIYGPDAAPDADGTALVNLDPTHNDDPDGPTWTFQNSNGQSRLDYIVYGDSLLTATDSLVLNSTELSFFEREALGLLPGDTVLNLETGRFDHLPLVADFTAIPEPSLLGVLLPAGLLMRRRGR